LFPQGDALGCFAVIARDGFHLVFDAGGAVLCGKVRIASFAQAQFEFARDGCFGALADCAGERKVPFRIGWPLCGLCEKGFDAFERDSFLGEFVPGARHMFPLFQYAFRICEIYKSLAFGGARMAIWQRLFKKRVSQEELPLHIAELRSGEARAADEARQEFLQDVARAKSELAEMVTGGAQHSLAGMVLGRLSGIELGNGTDMSAFMREMLELCEHSAQGPRVRRIVLRLEPKLAVLRESEERAAVLEEVTRALEQKRQVEAVRKAGEARRAEIDAMLAEVTVQIEDLLARKAELQESEAYVRLRDEARRVSGVRERIEAEIRAVFGPARELFLRAKEGSVLAKYRDNPVAALASDFSLRVIKEAQELAASARADGPLDARLLAAVAGLREDVLGPLVHRYAAVRRVQKQLREEILQSEIVRELDVLMGNVREREGVRDRLVAEREKLAVQGEREIDERLRALVRPLGFVLV